MYCVESTVVFRYGPMLLTSRGQSVSNSAPKNQLPQEIGKNMTFNALRFKKCGSIDTFRSVLLPIFSSIGVTKYLPAEMLKKYLENSLN